MLDKIIRFSIKNKLIIALLTLLLVVWGVWSATKIPIDAVPDITNNQVQIITTAPTLASQEVEQFITYPIEQKLANIPGLIESRSVSRFGLSVITVVFEDEVDIYFARQLISERLKEAVKEIPPGLGTPELAPVSTGLGEVYQYMLHPKKGSEHKYSAMDLRTLQDWIVARQLYGTPGVAEVNSFGGMLKQYEVAIDPSRLKAFNITIGEIFSALEKNNQNTGGAYIDKKPNAYFIRGIGVLTTLEDIGKVAVKNLDGIPVYISNVATVKLGNAVRYGAMTYNGEHEVIGGIVMMLKGSNSAEVVKRVKQKMEVIRKSLPPDIEIHPFLDRTTLVERAIATVEKNLIEGALIVIFVLVLFLGNLRAGLIVASAIPLSMLFALGMMNIFGVSANLMSLGAIDFGLIVDGAVIIVEATLHHLGVRKTVRRMTQHEMDREVFISASKIRKSAAFGEIIILIVYIPVLTLVGIEGKMFRPMAQTVGFAIFGALVLSMTYIPMMCARFLPKAFTNKRTISDKMMDIFHKAYAPILRFSIRAKYVIVSIAAGILFITMFLFSRMGSEFIPQLQEGDYAFHCILPQGSSLSQSIETSMQASRIIRTFPEVKEVIGKTGSAEVPTDPMPPEASDLIIVLKPKKEWRRNMTYNGLAKQIEEKLSNIPGVIIESNQPIQMRFNELMTGVRQDVAVKIFGENIDTLSALAPSVARIITLVPGVSAPQVERISGMPQITVQYDRARLAGYGLNISDVNDVISTAFAGKSAGVIFEDERKFDLVVRLDSANRNSIEDVANLYVPSGTGTQIPLSQVATVSFVEGPAQISREDGRRRMVIGFNVRDRDVQSVVTDIKQKLSKPGILPTGYYFTYGGTFENLQQASSRLMVAVPVALLLIFTLLYFTFHSAKQAALIFTAIPMSAIGGVFALLLRDMPFSISAGVGFIALFGVAVLNGIVLITQFNQLASDGIEDPVERVITGTKVRLRPVLMTATVASLGFLPMALSTGAGAEVQKPLATVVIGGLVTATLLTLVVLPVLYIIFSQKTKRINFSGAKLLLLTFGATIISSAAHSQRSIVRLPFQSVYDSVVANNINLKAADLGVSKARLLAATWRDIPRTGMFIENEDLNPSDNKGILKIGLSQSLDWPGVYRARRDLLDAHLISSEISKQIKLAEIRRDVEIVYYTSWYLQNRKDLFLKLDSIYKSLANAAKLRVRTGESAGLDSIAAVARSYEVFVQAEMINRDIAVQLELLRNLSNSQHDFLPPKIPLEKIPSGLDLNEINSHPLLLQQAQFQKISIADLEVQKQSNKPSFDGRFFSQRLYGISNPYSGFSVTMSVPLMGTSANRNRVKAAEKEVEYQELLLEVQRANLLSETKRTEQQMEKSRAMLDYYETTGLKHADEIIKAADIAYRAGEISFADMSHFLTQAIDIRRNYIELLHQYNLSIIQLKYYQNK